MQEYSLPMAVIHNVLMFGRQHLSTTDGIIHFQLVVLSQWHKSASYQAASFLAIIVSDHETVPDNLVRRKRLSFASIAWFIPNEQSLPSEQTHG
jgi:hypothetical protein